MAGLNAENNYCIGLSLFPRHIDYFFISVSLLLPRPSPGDVALNHFQFRPNLRDTEDCIQYFQKSDFEAAVMCFIHQIIVAYWQ